MAAHRVQDLAKRLVELETTSSKFPPGELFDPRVCERLRLPLSSLAGKAGFEALLARALSLTKPVFPSLASAKVTAEGHLVGLAEIRSRLTPQEAIQAEIALVSNLLELLWTFLGENLMIRLLQNVWPDATFNDNSGKETRA